MHTNVRSIVVSGAESANGAPPIPPRRKKRKVRPPIAKSSDASPSSSVGKKERKRLAPPPPPRAVRSIDSPKSKEGKEGTLNSLSSIETCETSQPSSIQFEETDSSGISNRVLLEEAARQGRDEEEGRNERAGSGTGCSPQQQQQQQAPFVFEAFSRKEANKYPPLLFTLHDFQNVMADTLQGDLDRKDYSPRNSLEFSTSLDDPRRDTFRDSFHEFFEKSLDDEESELSFRVTTTNLPFEKCLDRWAATLEDQIIENMDKPTSFIFEDYMDRSNKVNIRRSSAPMCYDAKDEDASKVVGKLTKVRFVIESPSCPERGLENELASIDSSASEEADGWNRASSVQLTEIADDANWTDASRVLERGVQEDEFGDVPFSSVLRNSSGEWSLEGQDKIGSLADEEDRFDSAGFESRNKIFSWPSEEKLKITEVGEVEEFGGGCLTDEKDGFNSAGFDPGNRVFSWPEEKLKITEVEDEFGDGFLEGRDGFNATKFDSRNRVCSWPEEKLKITKLGEEEGGLDLGVRTERCSEGEGSNGPGENADLADTASNNNVEDNKEYLINEHNSTNITRIISKTAATGTEDNTDSKSELIRNEINGNFLEEGSAVDEKEDSFAANEHKSLTINKTKVLESRATNEVGNNVLKNNLLPNIRKSEASEEASSSIEEDTNVDGCVKIIDPPDRSTGGYKRKIFVNESLRSMINHYYFTSNDLEEESEDSDEESNACDIPSNDGNSRKEREATDKDHPINELSSGKKSVGVPVDIRRNFFLENMLSEDADESWTSCRIVAARPKSPAKKKRENVADRLNESIKMDLEIQKILQESKEVGETGLSTTTAQQSTRKVVETGKKNPSDVKCDVLNELLSNFNSIRLKPVSRVEKKRGADESRSLVERTNDENINSESRSSAKQWRHAACLTTRKILNNWKCDGEPGKKQSEQAQDDANFPAESPDKTDPCSRLSQERHQPCPTKTILKNEVSRNDASSSVETGVEPIKAAEISKVSDVGGEETWATRDEEKLVRRTREEWKERKSDAVGGTRDEENGGGGGRLEEEAQTGGCSEKTDARDESYYNRGAIARQFELSAISGEKKSAIARRNSRPHCNNNDNNRAVTTPVVLSDDQSRDVVTITPGRVRKFVKYYEIRHEVTTTDKDSKANDRLDREEMLGLRSVCSIRRGLEARVDTLDAKKKRRNDSPTDSTRRESGVETGINADDLLIEDDHAEAKREEMVRVSSSTRGGKTKRKKSVKFQGGFTVIGAKSLEDNGPAGSLDGQNAKPVERRKIPDRQRQRGAALVDKVDFQDGQPEELADADSRSFEDRDSAAAQVSEQLNWNKDSLKGCRKVLSPCFIILTTVNFFFSPLLFSSLHFCRFKFNSIVL